MNLSFENVADEVNKILNRKREKFTSICVRLGKKIKVYETQKWKNMSNKIFIKFRNKLGEETFLKNLYLDEMDPVMS